MNIKNQKPHSGDIKRSHKLKTLLQKGVRQISISTDQSIGYTQEVIVSDVNELIKGKDLKFNTFKGYYSKGICPPKDFCIGIGKVIFDKKGFDQKDLQSFFEFGGITNYEEEAGKYIKSDNAVNEDISRLSRELIKANSIIRKFDSYEDYYLYLSERVKTAQKMSILRSHYEAKTPQNTSDEGRQYRDNLKLRVSEGLVLHRVFIVHRRDTAGWINEMIEEHKSHALYISYHITKLFLPVLTFVYIDDQEVIIKNEIDRTAIKVTSIDIISLFKMYFDSMWANGRVLKDTNGVNKKNLKKLNDNL